MRLRSLVPFRESGNLARPEASMFGSLQREIDRLFEDVTRSFGGLASNGGGNLLPRMDVSETDKEIEITTELPGLAREDVEISVDDDVLTIRGEKKMETERQEDGSEERKNYHVTERTYGVFYRAIQLPSGIDPSSIEATMSNGVLKIRIPKPQHSEAKKIEVKEAA